MGLHKTRPYQGSTRDRSIAHSLQKWVSTKTSISQLTFFHSIRGNKIRGNARKQKWGILWVQTVACTTAVTVQPRINALMNSASRWSARDNVTASKRSASYDNRSIQQYFCCEQHNMKTVTRSTKIVVLTTMWTPTWNYRYQVYTNQPYYEKNRHRWISYNKVKQLLVLIELRLNTLLLQLL